MGKFDKITPKNLALIAITSFILMLVLPIFLTSYPLNIFGTADLRLGGQNDKNDALSIPFHLDRDAICSFRIENLNYDPDEDPVVHISIVLKEEFDNEDDPAVMSKLTFNTREIRYPLSSVDGSSTNLAISEGDIYVIDYISTFSRDYVAVIWVQGEDCIFGLTGYAEGLDSLLRTIFMWVGIITLVAAAILILITKIKRRG